MGFFGSLFGSNDKKQITASDMPEGQWLNSERDSSWRKIAEFSNGEPIEFSPESCFKNDMGNFVVLRSFDKKSNTNLFMGCFIPLEQEELVVFVVDRLETTSGKVLRKDNWDKKRALLASRVPSIANLITAARNNAKFNNYKTIPPYVLFLSIMLNSD